MLIDETRLLNCPSYSNVMLIKISISPILITDQNLIVVTRQFFCKWLPNLQVVIIARHLFEKGMLFFLLNFSLLI